MLYIAAIIALSCSFLGVYISFFLDSSPAATIVLLMSAVFFVLFSYKNYTHAKLVKALTKEHEKTTYQPDQHLQNTPGSIN
jgi:manganese/iron transport system permease protein